MPEPAKISFTEVPKEPVKLPEEGIAGLSAYQIFPLTACGPMVIDPHDVRWANLDASDVAGDWAVQVQFKDDNPPIIFKGLDGRRVLKIIQDAANDVPDEQTS